MPPVPRLLPAGDSAIVVEYGDGIDLRINARVRLLHRALGAGRPAGVVETVPAYRSLMVHYDPIVLSREAIERWIAGTADRLPAESPAACRTVEIPVVYGGAAGPDLADVAAHAGLDEQEVAALHASGAYVVFMLGFMPGFPYLGGLPERIATPRLATPRTLVPAGSVGHCRSADRYLPRREPGRLAAHRAHADRAVRPARIAARAARGRRPRPIRSGDHGRLRRDRARRCRRPSIVQRSRRRATADDGHRGARRRPADHGAGPRALRRPAVRGAGVGGDGRVGASRGEPAGRQPRGRRGAGNHAGGARPAVRRARRHRLDRRRPRRAPRRAAAGAMAVGRRPSRRRVVVCRPAGRPARLPRRRRRHRRAPGAREPLDAAQGAARRFHGTGPRGRRSRSRSGRATWRAAAQAGACPGRSCPPTAIRTRFAS